MRSLLQDVRYALRTLRTNPVLTIVTVLSLAIGIGANTAIFTIMDRLLLREMPIRQPEQLVLLRATGMFSGTIESQYGYDVSFSWPKYRALRDQSSAVFDGLIARFPFSASIAAQDQTESDHGELVSGNYFDVLGLRPSLGRLIENSDAAAPNSNPVAVLSYAYWMRRFGGDRGVLNRAVVVNGCPLTIVGVTQRGFGSLGAGEAPSVFVPVTMKARMTPTWDQLENPHAYWLNLFGRLKPGETREEAQRAMAVIWSRVLFADVNTLPAKGARARSQYLKIGLQLEPRGKGISGVRDDFSVPLYLLMGSVGLVLLIACANIANLLLGRAAARSREIAIRVSLGAGRARLVRQFLAESLLLSLGGGLAGLLVAPWAGSMILRLIPQGIPMAGVTADPDLRALAFTFVVSVATGLLFGCVPALRATRPDPAAALREQSSTLMSGSHGRVRRVLVVAQIALSVLLLASAGLFAHSLYNLRVVNPGFRAEHMFTLAINPRLIGYPAERSQRLTAELQRSLASIPGVTGVTMASESLLTDSQSISAFMIQPSDASRGEEKISLSVNNVGARFFSVMGIPLIAGREIEDSDVMGGAGVAVINQTLAKKFFAGRDPLGQRLRNGRKGTVLQIVGVVRDSKYDNLREKPKPFVFLAEAQDREPGAMTYYVRTTLAADAFAPALREVVRRLDANLTVTGPTPMRDEIMKGVFLDRMVAALACAFAALATLLAAVGLYGVIAWAVARRTREIGIRMALGAHAGDVMRMVLAEVFWLAVTGVLIAAPLFVVAARVVESKLYGVSSHDPLALTAAIVVAVLSAAAAGLIPALRAARIDPIGAIRYQ